MEEIAKRYATAILESNQDMAERLESELTGVWSQINTEADLATTFYHPEISNQVKKDVLKRITKNCLPQTRLALDLLLDHKRLSQLGEIMVVYRQLRLAHQGEIEVTVESVIETSPETKQQIKQLVEKNTSLKPILLEKINPQLLGGIRLSYGDVLIDGSMSKSLLECIAIIRGK